MPLKTKKTKTEAIFVGTVERERERGGGLPLLSVPYRTPMLWCVCVCVCVSVCVCVATFSPHSIEVAQPCLNNNQPKTNSAWTPESPEENGICPVQISHVYFSAARISSLVASDVIFPQIPRAHKQNVQVKHNRLLPGNTKSQPFQF